MANLKSAKQNTSEIFIRIGECIGAEECDGRVWVADEWSQQPRHLNRDYGENDQPSNQNFAMTTVALFSLTPGSELK